MLRCMMIGACKQDAVVGPVRPRGPDLLSVDNVGIAISIGSGREAGQVGASAGPREELAPVFISSQQGPEKPILLSIRACR
jgi:hypothetical protein